MMRYLRRFAMSFAFTVPTHAKCPMCWRSHACYRVVDHRGACWCECGDRRGKDDRVY